MREKIGREYLRRTSKQLETKLRSRNLMKGINTWAEPRVRYSGPFVKWTREELQQMDQRIRKLMTMHKTLHPRDDVDRLYVLRKEVGRGFARFQDCVDALIQRLEDYIKSVEEDCLQPPETIKTTQTSTEQNKKTKMGRNELFQATNK